MPEIRMKEYSRCIKCRLGVRHDDSSDRSLGGLDV